MRPSPKVWLPLVFLAAGAFGVRLLVLTAPEPEPRPPELTAPLVRAAWRARANLSPT